MSLSILSSRAIVGTSAPEIHVEVHLSRGLPSCAIVGMPETAVRESRDRVRGAIINTGFEFPRQRIIVNLAPADLPKVGGGFDLAIAMGILAASGQINATAIDRFVFLGELALSGELRPVRGALIAAMSLRQGHRVLVLPRHNAAQAAYVRSVRVAAVDSLASAVSLLADYPEITLEESRDSPATPGGPDFADVIGQPFPRRALEIAAAGQHSVLMTGPPGAGKTMLASRIGSILPPMTDDEALESAAIASLGSNGFDPGRWRIRPFRAPHHSASGPALIGGGSVPRPGEISLAHNGVLFLDELPEFSRHVLEQLREPLESGEVHISRASRQCRFMARILLVAAANPCPCGYLGDNGRCQCTPEQVARYRGRLSGPLLDRIDMHIDVTPVPRSEMRGDGAAAEASAAIRHRVEVARERQIHRQGCSNALLAGADLSRFCALSSHQEDLLDTVACRFGLSTRGLHRIMRMGRTVADLNGRDRLSDEDLLLAVQLRCRAPG